MTRIKIALAGATGWTVSGAQPYVAGTLLAACRVGSLTGLVRGLDAILGLP